jgi:hypothetical protein
MQSKIAEAYEEIGLACKQLYIGECWTTKGWRKFYVIMGHPAGRVGLDGNWVQSS